MNKGHENVFMPLVYYELAARPPVVIMLFVVFSALEGFVESTAHARGC